MLAGVFNERSFRNSEGVKPNLLAPATNGTWLKKHEAPIVPAHHVGHLCLVKGRRRRVKDSEQSDIQAPNPSPLSSPFRKGRGERRGRTSPTTPDHGVVVQVDGLRTASTTCLIASIT